jgi:hypothetical protein
VRDAASLELPTILAESGARKEGNESKERDWCQWFGLALVIKERAEGTGMANPSPGFLRFLPEKSLAFI